LESSADGTALAVVLRLGHTSANLFPIGTGRGKRVLIAGAILGHRSTAPNTFAILAASVVRATARSSTARALDTRTRLVVSQCEGERGRSATCSPTDVGTDLRDLVAEECHVRGSGCDLGSGTKPGHSGHKDKGLERHNS
jgi:hypothetical protein